MSAQAIQGIRFSLSEIHEEASMPLTIPPSPTSTPTPTPTDRIENRNPAFHRGSLMIDTGIDGPVGSV
ncbi:hypothetical protein JZ751_029754 [Albula glossodonta]|uniref:Uncharacterized protein n=1 Tax=Albula glossodonta TaxID=121402 RepID=A0A8T2MRD6_9TELE|nr:hypothetical protein JZ751_029754 [Albula glossodonta]